MFILFVLGMIKVIVETCAEIRSVYSKHLKYTNATDKVSHLVQGPC